jgi:lipopolysaccharide biosynthesis glycosyltransferase
MKTALVMGGTPNLAGPSGVTYLSLKLMSPKLFNSSDKFFYTSENIPEKDFSALKNIGIQTRLFEASISRKASSHIRYFSKGILAKFEVFRLIEFYDRVIWFDADQICVRELLEVVNTNSKKEFFIVDGGENSDGWSNFIKNPVELKEWLNQNPNITFDSPGICGNFYCVSKKSDAYVKGLDLFKQMQSELYGGEQGILYILMQIFFTQNVLLDSKMFSPHPDEWPFDKLLNFHYNDRPYFIHAYSQPKFWNGMEYVPWNFFYSEWLKIGGGSFMHLDQSIFSNISNLKAAISKIRRIIKSIH